MPTHSSYSIPWWTILQILECPPGLKSPEPALGVSGGPFPGHVLPRRDCSYEPCEAEMATEQMSGSRGCGQKLDVPAGVSTLSPEWKEKGPGGAGKLQSFILCPLGSQATLGLATSFLHMSLLPGFSGLSLHPPSTASEGRVAGRKCVISWPRMFIVYVGPAVSRASLSFHV